MLAVNDRQVWVEVGYDLEEFITDGFAGETSRRYMAPEFRRGNYGAGLLAGVSRIIARIAERRGQRWRAEDADEEGGRKRRATRLATAARADVVAWHGRKLDAPG